MAGEQQQIEALRKRVSDTTKRLHETRRQIRQAIQRENSRISAEVNRAMQENARELQRQAVQFARSLERRQRERMEALLREQKQLETRKAELEQALERLQREQQRIQQEQQREAAERKNLAVSTYEELKRACDDAARLPVDPQRFRIFQDLVGRVRSLISLQKYSEAYADGSNARLGIRRLKAETESHMNAFHSALLRYQSATDRVLKLLRSDAIHCITDESGKPAVQMTDAELDYWSDGLFAQVSAKVGEHSARVKEMLGDEAAWLRRQTPEQDPVEFIRRQTEDLQRLTDLIGVVAEIAFSAAACYEAAFRIRDRVSSCLQQQNFHFRGMEFGPLPACPSAQLSWYAVRGIFRNARCFREGGAPDFRSERRLYYENPSADLKLQLRLVPERTGARSDNRIYVSADPLLEQTVRSLLGQAAIVAEPDIGGVCSEHCVPTVSDCERILAERTRRYAEQALIG